MRVRNLFKDEMILYNHYVAGITDNSKEVKKNYVFVAIKGYKNNGYDYIADAIRNGAKTIVSDIESVKSFQNEKVNVVYCFDARLELARILKIKYQKCREMIEIISVSGTNAKTSICTLVYKYLKYLNVNVMYIGTNGVFVNDIIYKTDNTTLGIVNFYKCLECAVNNHCKYIVMEVSSQGLKECRVKYLEFDLGLLTNITIDHLDYHKTFDDYFYTKINYLNCCKKIIVNGSCDNFNDILSVLNRQDVLIYGIKNTENIKYDYFATNISLSLSESNFYLNLREECFKYYINTKLLGDFNVSNIVGFIAIIDNINQGVYLNNNIFSYLNNKIDISGRLEIIKTNKGTFIVDFAHTPDGVMKVLSFLKDVCIGKLICCMGLGGSRDATKRPIVGGIVSKFADYFIITSDNPRDEDNDVIVCDILKGINKEYQEKVIIINDRYEAIEKSYLMANENDLVAILGKGNEEEQIILNVKYKFNDIEVLKEIINRYQGEINE